MAKFLGREGELGCFTEMEPKLLHELYKRMHERLAELTYTMEAANAGFLIRQTGVGKSCLLKVFLNSLARNRYNPVYLNVS